MLIITEILETQESSTTTVKAEVHPVPGNLDLEVKLEQMEEEEGEENKEQDQDAQSESERAATALLLLSQPKIELQPQQADLWEGNILKPYLFSCVIQFFGCENFLSASLATLLMLSTNENSIAN